MSRVILYANTLIVFVPLAHWLLLVILPTGARTAMQLCSALVLALPLIPALMLPTLRSLPERRNRVFLLFSLTLLGLGVYFFYQMVSVRPMGMWDAWSQWNLKARDYSLSFLQGQEFILTRPEWFNAQYPPAYPLFLSFWTVMIGDWSQMTPILVNAGLYGLPVILVQSLERGWDIRHRLLALLLLMGLLLTPQIWLNAANLCADTYLGTVLLLSVYWAFRACDFTDSISSSSSGSLESHSSWMLSYAIMNAGFLLLVKPEGIILAPFALGTIFIVNRKWIRRFSFSIWIPLLFSLGLLIVFKAYSVERTHYELVFEDILRSLINWDRYGRLLTHFIAVNLLSSGAVLLVFLILAIRRNWKRTLSWAGPLLLAFACYHGIFIITPIDQEAHLQQAYSRILMHLYPALLLILFLITRSTPPQKNAVINDRSASQ